MAGVQVLLVSSRNGKGLVFPKVLACYSAVVCRWRLSLLVLLNHDSVMQQDFFIVAT
jgi:hypothetical protein